MTFSVLRNINRFADKSKLLNAFAIFSANYLLYLMLAFLLLLAFTVNNWHLFFYPLLCGLFAAFVINSIVYLFYQERRPAEFEGVKALISVPKNPSFPSRHAALLFGASFYLFFYSVPLAMFFIAGSCLVGIARVFVGVHWFRDILAGIFVGFLSTLIIYSLLNYIK